MLALDSLVKRYVLELDEPMHGGRYYLHNQDSNKYIIDFSTSINPLGASQHVIKAIIDNLIGNSNSITEYPDPHARMLKSSISKYIGIDEDYILVGNGSSEIIYTLADTFIKEDDKVAIVEPTFLEYARACKKNGATIKHIMMNNLKLDYDIIEENIINNDNDIKMLFICNPNNPTGILTDYSIMLKVIEYCYNKGIVVVLDECFIEFTDEQGYAIKVKEFDNLVVIRSLTKAFGLAGLRVGYCVSDPRIVKVLSKAKVPWSVNAIAQIAGINALSDLEHLSKSKSVIMKEKVFLINHLRYKGIKPLESDTNFFLLRLEGFNSKMLRDALLSKGILVRDCSNFYGMNNSYIRISTRLRDDNITLIDAIKSIL
jgi:threonine-phosphate decarboxylase